MNLNKAIVLAGALALATSTSAMAGVAFGTAEQAKNMATKLADIVSEQGVDAGINAMHDPGQPFATSQMGVHLFESTIIVADNREPELIASSYAEVQDLTGEAMWPRIVAAADKSTDAILEWYHYDTEEEYTYHCFSQWATKGETLVMVCR